jgi:diacylglycerol kinase (ATP)
MEPFMYETHHKREQHLTQSRNHRAMLIVNPEAGQVIDDPELPETIKRLLATYNIQTEIKFVTLEHTVTELAHQAVARHYPIVIVAGGDGTVQLAARALRSTHTKLGIIPLGTINNLAYSLGIPEDIEGACAIIGKLSYRAIDVGLVNGKSFMEVVSIGAEASFFPLAESARHKGLWSAIRAILQGIQMLSHLEQHAMTIELDGKRRRIHAWQITICNGPIYGLRFQASPRAKLDDGYLDILIAQYARRWDLIRHYRSILHGNGIPSKSPKIRRARRVRIFGRDRLPVAIDGEYFGETPVTISLVPHSLSVLCGDTPDMTVAGPTESATPLAMLVRSLTSAHDGTNEKLHTPEEAYRRFQFFTNLYWIVLPVVLLLTGISRFFKVFPFNGTTNPGVIERIVPLKNRLVLSRILATSMALIFARLRLGLEVLALLASGSLRPLTSIFRWWARRDSRIIVPDEGTMRAVAGTGILGIGLWSTRKGTPGRNIFLLILIWLATWFAGVGRHDVAEPTRRRDSIALGAGIGLAWLGGSLVIISALKRRILRLVRPAIAPGVEGTQIQTHSTSVPISVPGRKDIVPLVSHHPLERGDIVLFGPDNTFGARLIEFLSHSHYHHVAIYDGDGMVIEAMPEGVNRYALGDRSVIGIRPDVLPQQRKIAADWAREHDGDQYDTRGVILIAIDRIFPGLRLGTVSANRFSCAVFVAEAYLRAGINLFPNQRWQDLIPGDFTHFINDAVPEH